MRNRFLIACRELAAPAAAAAVGGAGVAAAPAAIVLDTPVVDAAAIAGFTFDRYKAAVEEVAASNTELVTAISAVKTVRRREYRLAAKGPATAVQIACVASEVERPAEAVIKEWHAPITAPTLTEVRSAMPRCTNSRAPLHALIAHVHTTVLLVLLLLAALVL